MYIEVQLTKMISKTKLIVIAFLILIASGSISLCRSGYATETTVKTGENAKAITSEHSSTTSEKTETSTDIFVLVSLISNVFTILAAGIAIYIFVFKRKAVASAFRVLLNYAWQVTLLELRMKIERLNDLSLGETSDVAEIESILGEIDGQIKGNPRLNKGCSDIQRKLSKCIKNIKLLTEPKKRSIISELKERLKHIDIENLNALQEVNYEQNRSRGKLNGL